MTNIGGALAALADPTRRAIFERVARRPGAVGDIAAGFAVSRPAVSQHLAVLRAAGLVIAGADGARRIYRVDRAGLAGLRLWLDRFWGEALDAFAAAADDDGGTGDGG